MIKNLANDRVYIGQSKDPKARYRAHSKSPPFRMRKDAEKFTPFKDFFHMTVLQGGLSKHEADMLEESYIEMHDATSKKGYNWCFGKPTCGKRWWATIRRKFGARRES